MLIAVGNSINGGAGSGTGAGGGGGSPRTAPVFRFEVNPIGRVPQTAVIAFGADSTFPFSVFVGDDPEQVINSTADTVTRTLNSSSDSADVSFSFGATFSLNAGKGLSQNIRRVFRFDNIILGDFFSEIFSDKNYAVTTLPAGFQTSLRNTLSFATALPSNIGLWKVDNVGDFSGCFAGVDPNAMSDAFGQWTFGDSAAIGELTFENISNADLESCLVQWESNPNQGTGVDVSQFPFERDQRGSGGVSRTLSESTYPAAKVAYDNLIANNSWSFGTSINWVP